ncbi:DUF1109 domain-containing protein [Paraburkholderia phosphatilytica]|uniref:DUF1109 domain-containing protein n=1 Tax=Paraburkholderia phosphatilytica TaxID=2282883 RepID=UPI000E513E96|nr:DUF1109 domain-containing protein [Paraburkholderia phosphatilytica]
MKTQELVSLLSAGVAPVDPHVVARRFTWALVIGGAGSIALMALCYGLRPDLGEMLHTPLFWAKCALPFCLALAALVVTTRLSRPGVAVREGWAALAAPIAAVWIGALAAWYLTPPDARVASLMGYTWRTCPLNIAFLSLPGIVTVFWAIRGLAPVRLRVAGAAGGLLAGATATLAYCLHCPEMGVPFWAVWYLLGMALPTAVGALLGPKLLRW